MYLYVTEAVEGGFRNRVERYTLVDDALTERTVIIRGIPGAPYHDGGQLAFGPDGYLYITTGDAGEFALAQDRSSLAGKILRLRDDGTIPADNPFGTAIYSYGHRNAQGLAWDSSGRLWATEHGRSGISSGFDELNRIVPGGNYGWPKIQGDEEKEGLKRPVAHSGPDETWAPAGIAYFEAKLSGPPFTDRRLYFAGLRGSSLYEARLSEDGSLMSLRAHLRETYGRLRAVTLGSDGYLYVSTSNQDGRGEPRPGDDKILRIDTALFEPKRFGR